MKYVNFLPNRELCYQDAKFDRYSWTNTYLEKAISNIEMLKTLTIWITIRTAI